ncbi:MAG: hypothetical protein KatS3mg028_0915 [Bacteroidia bacterium]|nr:MAG: hypothetical protein KatS3mg028_0915 [Bacteroidia bacterium]
MWLNKDTHIQQSLLAEYTRTGDVSLLPQLKGTKEKGIRYYRHLIFNIIWDGVSNAYPITTDFFGEEKMKDIVNDFFRHHRCQTFQVWQMPLEFKDYLIQHRNDLIHQYPFLPDLLLFEWMEIEIFMMPDEELPAYSGKGNILKDKLILNPEMQILNLQYPVHIYHPKKIQENLRGNYFVLMHRHPEDKDVLFSDISELSVKVLQHLFDQPMSFSELCSQLNIESSALKTELRKFLVKGMESKFILGFEQK